MCFTPTIIDDIWAIIHSQQQKGDRSLFSIIKEKRYLR